MRIEPKGTQQEVLALEPRGHIVVLGAAGSGKTTMALLLAEKLSNLPHEPKVLVVTFNRALVAYMEAIQSFKKGVVVENFHHFCLGYLKSQGKKTDYVIIPENAKDNIVNEIVEEKRREYPKESTFLRPVNTFIEEILFLERFGVNSLAQYKDIERIGRADTFISRENRHWFYEVYELYKQKRLEKGYLYDWDDLAISVYNELLMDENERRYTHIIVDEGQDFSPMMLKVLIAAVPPAGSFTFFGDIAQQIYGTALSWKASGIDTKKIWRFENNYRNPVEIAQFAQDILKHPKWEQKGDEYVASKIECPAAGIKPILIKYSNNQNEIVEIAKLLKRRGGRNVIVVKNRQLVGEFLCELQKNNILAKEIKKEYDSCIGDGVYVTTFYSVKGLEFDNVFIPFLNKEDYPDKKRLEDSENKDKVCSNALKLLYVAVTRATQSVVMSYSSVLTELFPKDSQNYINRGI